MLDIKKFAHMIRIDVPADMDISVIDQWREEMRGVNTDGIEPMFTPAEHAAPLRTDTVIESENNIRDKVLANAPDAQNGYFAVPKVMDGE